MSASVNTEVSRSEKLIFLVEDDMAIARLIVNTLKDYQFRCECFRTGGDLLRRIRVASPDLCIVDLGLPDMDGMELVQQVKSRSRCGLMILTGRAHVGDRVMGLEIGADDYVMKPFEPRELIARMRSILRRCEQLAEAPISGRVACFSGWRYDPQSYTLFSPDGSKKSISASEGQMLQRFLERPNRVLPREQLLGQNDMSPFDRSIDVRVSRLRRKLGDDTHNPRLIKTVYGAGYLFVSSVTWE